MKKIKVVSVLTSMMLFSSLAQAGKVQQNPIQQDPTQNDPIQQEMPIQQDAPIKGKYFQDAPPVKGKYQQDPIQDVPVQQGPVQEDYYGTEAPIQDMPIQEGPVQDDYYGTEAPIQDMLIQQDPVQQSPIQQDFYDGTGVQSTAPYEEYAYQSGGKGKGGKVGSERILNADRFKYSIIPSRGKTRAHIRKVIDGRIECEHRDKSSARKCTGDLKWLKRRGMVSQFVAAENLCQDPKIRFKEMFSHCKKIKLDARSGGYGQRVYRCKRNVEFICDINLEYDTNDKSKAKHASSLERQKIWDVLRNH